MTPTRYLAMTDTEQVRFLERALEFDIAIDEVKEKLKSIPQWMWDYAEQRRPGTYARMTNLPSVSEIYGGLQRK